MPESRKIKKEKVVTTVKSVHVVFFSCQHCGDEVEDIKMCPECGKPMRVIDVVEKFGDEADAFLKKVKGRIVKEDDHSEDFVASSAVDEEPNIILMGTDDAVLDTDGGLDPHDDDDGLDVIFPDESDDAPVSRDVSIDDDLSDALAQLDSEEEENVSAEDFGFDKDEIPEL